MYNIYPRVVDNHSHGSVQADWNVGINKELHAVQYMRLGSVQ